MNVSRGPFPYNPANMRNRIDISSLIRATVVCAVLALFLSLLYLRYKQDAAALRFFRLQYAAAQMGRRVEQQLVTRVGVLELFARMLPELKLSSDEDFARWSRYVRSGVPGFFAINFMTPDGTITRVEPYEENKAALGKNPASRPEIRPILDAAVATRLPTMTYFVNLFQGPLGFAVYVPIFDGDELKGFVNGVFLVEEFFGPMTVAGSDVVAARVYVAGRPTPYFASSGAKGLDDIVGSNEVRLYGQNLVVEVRASETQAKDSGVNLLIVGLCGSVLLISVVSYFLMRSRTRLRERLDRERFQGVLLNLLVHDIQNPVFVTRYSLDAAMKYADESVAKQLTKTYYGLNQLQDVINRVRDMRAIELGKNKPKLAAVMVNDLIRDTQSAFEARLREKGIIPDFQLSPENPALWVDRVIFQNNVLNNVLSNALKFSESGTKISMTAKTRRDTVVIEVRDQGMGMSPELAAILVQEGEYGSRPGTRGEAGTGIGMLQVVAYTRIFGGRVEIASRAKAQFPEDSGTVVSLTLPKVRPSDYGPHSRNS